MAELLKHRYNQSFFQQLINDFAKHHQDFKANDFLDLIYSDGWEDKELKDRMRHISLKLQKHLQLPYAQTIALFKKVISETEGTSFERMFFPDYVEVFGMEELELSLDALAHFTPYASSEFAIRPFIKRYPERLMQQLQQWAEHPNFHVRRLASEGCRPRLPWAMALPAFKANPEPILPILEKLKADPEDYVRRSVANNLNDISKDHPTLALEIAEKWHGKNNHTNWVVKHACRGLLKQGHTRALVLFGFSDPSDIEVSRLRMDQTKIAIGEAAQFQFQLKNKASFRSKLRLEYLIHFVKKNGTTSPKVFQITENYFEPGIHDFSKKQSFHDLTTRKHHPGQHRLAIIVNGREMASLSFELF